MDQHGISSNFALNLELVTKIKSERIKSVDFHDSKPWIIASLFDGTIHLYDYDLLQKVKEWKCCELPIRCVKFISRENWFICGTDELNLRIVNYDNDEITILDAAHDDYIRTIDIHETLPYLVSGSDDCMIKLWTWENNNNSDNSNRSDNWKCLKVFDLHSHYIMALKIFSFSNEIFFVSSSLDKTAKFWSLNEEIPIRTFIGHEEGINGISLTQNDDNLLLATCGDDMKLMIWDTNNINCIKDITSGDQQRFCTSVSFSNDLDIFPIIICTSEDSSTRIYNSNSYEEIIQLSPELNRCWCHCFSTKNNNLLAIGCDDGLVLYKLNSSLEIETR